MAWVEGERGGEGKGERAIKSSEATHVAPPLSTPFLNKKRGMEIFSKKMLISVWQRSNKKEDMINKLINIEIYKYLNI